MTCQKINEFKQFFMSTKVLIVSKHNKDFYFQLEITQQRAHKHFKL